MEVTALKREVTALKREVTALKREVKELKTIINDLKDQVTRMDQEHEERMNHHREDIDWQMEECILLRVGLQENKDRTAELTVWGQQMSRQLCRCADHQGLPISAVGLPLPPPYARSPSPEFHTPPIKVCLIEDAESVPSGLAPVLGCRWCQRLQRSGGKVGGSDKGWDHPQLPEWKQSRSRGSSQQCMLWVIILLPIFTECNQENVPDQGPLSSRESAFNNEETVTSTLEEEVISAPPQSSTPAARTVSFLTDHQLELSIRALQAARLLDQDPTFWLMQGSIITNSFGCYRLELAIDLTEEEGDWMVHQLAGLGDRAESPPGLCQGHSTQCSQHDECLFCGQTSPTSHCQ